MPVMDTLSESLCLVKIVVRNVYTPSQSLALCVDPKMLVRELKCRLCADFPSNPSVSSQKLIFGGKICGNDESLTQILEQIQNSQQKEGKDDQNTVEPVVFHLLVSSTGVCKQPQNKDTKPSVQTQRSVITQAEDSPRPQNATAVMDSQSFSAPPLQFLAHQTSAMTQEQQNLFGQSVLMQQQTMVLQQIQYLQYLLLQQQPTSETQQQQQQQLPPPFGVHFTPPYGNFYGMMPPQMFHARPQGAQALPSARVHVPAAVEATIEQQTRSLIVEMAREVFSLLDFRMVLKMAFMLFIIGQDMPIDRIIMLGLLSLISYLHITGIFAKIYEVYNRRRNVNDGTAPNAAAGINAPRAAAAAGAAIVNRCGMLARVLRISADRGFVQDAKYFVVGLLLSLVPAWHPQPIQGAAPMRDNALPDDMPIQEI